MQLKLNHEGQLTRNGRPPVAHVKFGRNEGTAGSDTSRKELFARFLSELRKEMQAARAEEARLLQADKTHIARGGSLRKTPSGTDYIFWGKIGQGGVPDLLSRIDEEIAKCRMAVVISRTDFSTRYRFGRWLLRNGYVTADDMDEYGLVTGISA